MNKPALVNWANNLGLQNIKVDAYTDLLASIGTIAHETIRGILKGVDVTFEDYSQSEILAAQVPVEKFKAWYKAHSVEVILCEQPLVSEKYRYGGTLDLYAKINGKLTLLDWKTGANFYKEHFIQLSANKQLLEENGYKVEETMLVGVGRTEGEGFHELYVGGMAERFEQFQALLKVYDIDKRMGTL
jgi:hypothetical protein